VLQINSPTVYRNLHSSQKMQCNSFSQPFQRNLLTKSENLISLGIQGHLKVWGYVHTD